MADQVTEPPKPEEQDPKVTFWSQTSYDSTIFNNRRIHYADLHRTGTFHDSLIAAAREVYQMQMGRASTLSDKDLATWAIGFMRDNEQQVVGVEWGELFHGHFSNIFRGSWATSSTLKGASTTESQRLAFRYLKDVYEKYDDSTLSQVGSMMSDVSNVATAVVTAGTTTVAKTGGQRLITIGASRTAALEADVAARIAAGTAESIARQEAKEAASTLLNRAMNTSLRLGTSIASKPTISGAFTGAAIEGGLISNLDDRFKQSQSISIGEQYQYDRWRGLQATGFGILLGGGTGALMSKFSAHPGSIHRPAAPQGYVDAAERIVGTMPGHNVIGAAEQRQARLMGTAFSRYGIGLEDIQKRATQNWINAGNVDAAGNMLDQGAHMFNNTRRATIELISEQRAGNTAPGIFQYKKPDGYTWAPTKFSLGFDNLWSYVYHGPLGHSVFGARYTPGRLVPEFRRTGWMKFVDDFVPDVWPFKIKRDFFRNLDYSLFTAGRHYLRPAIQAMDESALSDLGPIFGKLRVGQRGAIQLENSITDSLATKISDISARLNANVITSQEAGNELQRAFRSHTTAFDQGLNEFSTRGQRVIREMNTLKSASNDPIVARRSIGPEQILAFERNLGYLNDNVQAAAGNARAQIAPLQAMEANIGVMIQNGANTADIVRELNNAATATKTAAVEIANIGRPKVQMDNRGYVTSALTFMQQADLRVRGDIPPELENRLGTGGKAWKENIRWLERGLEQDYANPHQRLVGIDYPTRNQENSERVFIEIENFYQEIETKAKRTKSNPDFSEISTGPALADKVWEAYKIGKENEALFGLFRLGLRQGKSRGVTSTVIPSTLIESLTRKYESSTGRKVGDDAHFKEVIEAIERLQTRIKNRHSGDDAGQRYADLKWFEWTDQIHWITRTPQHFRVAKVWVIDNYRMHRNNLADAYTGFWFGAGTKQDPGYSLRQRIDWQPVFGFRKAAEGEKLKTGITGFLNNAPGILTRAPLRIGTGGLASKRGLMIYGGLAGAGLAWDAVTGQEISWDKREDYLAYQLWQTAMIPAKTIAGAAVGWWNADGFWNTGGIKGGANAFWNDGVGGVYNTTLAGTRIPFTGTMLSRWGSGSVTTEAPKPAEDPAQSTTPPAQGGGQPAAGAQPPAAGAQPPAGGAPSTPGATGPFAAASGVTAIDVSKLKPEQRAQMEKEKIAVRETLRAFGKEVADLTNSLAKDGNWDAPTGITGADGKPVTRAMRVDQLVTLQQKLAGDIKKYDLGGYAESLMADGYNTLTFQLVPNKGKGKPGAVPTFEDAETMRRNGVLRPMVDWYNGVIQLNHDVVDNGWTPKNKERIKELERDRQKFYRDVFMLSQQYIDTEARGYNWMASMLQAANAPDPAYARVTKITDPEIDIQLVNPDGTPYGGARPQGAQRPVAGGDRAVGAPPAAAAGAAGGDPNANGSGITAEEQARIDAERARLGADGTAGGAGAAGADADAAAAAARRRQPRPEDPRSLGEVGLDLVRVDGDDDVTVFVDKLGRGIGGAASSAGGWLKNTYNRIRNKPDGSGRALIREAGAGILSLVAMGAAVGPLLDKIGIGKIPIIGSLAKLAALVVVFMVARKGIDSVMDPAPERRPAPRSTGVSQGEGQGTYFPDPVRGSTVDTQSSAGGTPKRFVVGDPGDKDPLFDQIIAEEGADGKGVLQVHTDNGQTYFSAGVVGDTVMQTAKNRANVPADRLGADAAGKIGAMKFEAVTGDRIGDDSFVMTIDGKNHVFRLDKGATFAELSPN